MAITIDGTNGITTPALDSEGNLEYSGTLTGGTGVIDIGSGQVFKDANGNVGIGKSSPDVKLVVESPDTEVARFASFNASNTGQIAIRSSGGAGNNTRGRIVGGFEAGGSNFGGFLAFNTTTTQNIDTEAARIDSGGRLLVARTTAFSDGTMGAPAIQCGGISGARVGLGLIQNTTAATGAIGFANPNGTVGGINTSGTSTSYNTSSDYRLKENLVPISDALTRIAAIPVYRFNFKADPTKTVDGFVAHELADFLPEAVTGEKDAVATVDVTDKEGKVIGTEVKPVHQGVDQSKITPLLTAAIQELIKEVNDLKAEVAILKGVA